MSEPVEHVRLAEVLAVGPPGTAFRFRGDRPMTLVSPALMPTSRPFHNFMMGVFRNFCLSSQKFFEELVEIEVKLLVLRWAYLRLPLGQFHMTDGVAAYKLGGVTDD